MVGHAEQQQVPQEGKAPVGLEVLAQLLQLSSSGLTASALQLPRLALHAGGSALMLLLMVFSGPTCESSDEQTLLATPAP